MGRLEDHPRSAGSPTIPPSPAGSVASGSASWLQIWSPWTSNGMAGASFEYDSVCFHLGWCKCSVPWVHFSQQTLLWCSCGERCSTLCGQWNNAMEPRVQSRSVPGGWDCSERGKSPFSKSCSSAVILLLCVFKANLDHLQNHLRDQDMLRALPSCYLTCTGSVGQAHGKWYWHSESIRSYVAISSRRQSAFFVPISFKSFAAKD